MLDFDNITPISSKLVFTFYLLSVALISLLIIFVFPTLWFNFIPLATGYLINSNLLVSIFMTFFTIYLLLIRYSSLTWEDLGFSKKRSRLINALVALLIIWVLMQLSSIIYSLMTNQDIILDSIWSEQSPVQVIGRFIGHLFGNAVYEELGYRAFLFPQIYLLMDRKLNLSKTVKLILSILLSQFLFSLLHLPIRIYNNDPLDFVTFLFLMGYGIFLVIVYIRTQNIFLAIVTHAFLNFNFPLIESYDFDVSGIFFITILLIILVYPKFFSKSMKPINYEIKTELE